MKKQNDFSRLFNDLTSEGVIQKDNTVKNPFIHFAKYQFKYNATIELNDFNQALSYQKTILRDTENAYECFLLEISLLEKNKSEYLNSIIDFLFKYNNLSIKKNNAVVSNAIRQTFTKICESPFNIYLNGNNRNRLSKWHALKEPIKSFILKKNPENKWFENKFRNTMKDSIGSEFISGDTSFSTFKALFEGKYLENKINWIDNKASLYYFIKLLISEKVIQNPKNKHWEIVSEFFLLNGEPIEQEKLINQKPTTKKHKIQIIKSFVKSLANY